jgi:hypothetical protein
VNAGYWGASAWVILLAACSSPPPRYPDQQQLPLGIEYAGRSSLVGSSSSSADLGSGRVVSVPHRARVTDSAQLSVRPDLLRVGFAVREVAATPAAALQAARAKVDGVSAELLKATRPTAVVKIKSFALARNTRDGKTVDISASVDGVLEVPLATNEDFWARSQLYASLIEAAQRLVDAYSGQDGVRAVSFETPESQVSDPERHRPELVERWVQRARQFANAAQNEGAPLVVRDCDPPGPVLQTPHSFDEVSLALAISCRIDTRHEPGGLAK